jgi:hypothetical protein
MNGQHSTGNGISHFRYWYQYWGMGRPLPVLVNCALGTYVRGNMDSIVICILRRAICILQKFLGDIDTSSKPFLFRRKESILHLDPYCRAIWILFFITDKNRQKPTYWACQVKHTSSQRRLVSCSLLVL